MSLRHILVTGVSSGFGWATVKRFLADPNFIVHATTRNGLLAESSALTDAERARLHVHSLDFTVQGSIEALAKKLAAQGAKIEILVNNAGYGLFSALEDSSEAQIRQQMEVNFFGTVLLTKAMLPDLRATHGHLINLSSAFGFFGFPMTGIYCASKFALEGWSESMLHELKSFEVKVSVIEPGSHRTRFGASVNWGENSFNATSPYLQMSLAYKRFLEKMKTRPNPAIPETVGEGIYKLVMRRNPAFRVRFGKDAAFGYWTRRLFPMSLVLGLSSRMFGKLFGHAVQA